MSLHVSITLISNFVNCTTAHKWYPVRIRIVNDVWKEITWMTVAYIPIVRKQTETAADDRSRLRRFGILQRVLYTCMRAAIAASHVGAEVRMGDRTMTVT